jgi:hypothetical protein
VGTEGFEHVEDVSGSGLEASAEQESNDRVGGPADDPEDTPKFEDEGP